MKAAHRSILVVLILLACVAIPLASLADVVYVVDYESSGMGSIKKAFPDGTITSFTPQFYLPGDIGFDSHANLLLLLSNANTIDKITPDGVVTTFVSGISASGLAIDASDNLYVSNWNTGQITKISPQGTQTPFAANGGGANGLTFGSGGNLYGSNYGSITQITPAGVVSVFNSGISQSEGIAYDGHGNLFVGGINSKIYKVDASGNATFFTNAAKNVGEFGLAFDHNGNLYGADIRQYTVSKFTPDGTRTTYATGFTYPMHVAVINPLGDFNRDGRFDSGDISVMMNALSDQSTYKAVHKLGNPDILAMGDFNSDGNFNAADLQAMLNALKSGGGSQETIPEPPSILLTACAALVFLVYARRIHI